MPENKENQKTKKSLKYKLSVAVTVLAVLALLAIFLTAVLQSGNLTTSPEEMQVAIKELVAQGYEEEITNSIGMKLRLVPLGTFLMGSPDPPGPWMTRLRAIGVKIGLMREKFYNPFACPQHEVAITEPFYMGVHEVTQEQYEKVIGMNPSHFNGKNLPVEMVSWDEATSFCEKLADIEKTSYSLPTEAQWEYACRAGTETDFYWGDAFDGRYAWVFQNSVAKTHDVGTREPNSLGLYDMSGNVLEWCSDWFEPYNTLSQKNPSGPASGARRVIRGGCWYYDAGDCRSAYRLCSTPVHRNPDLGFRVLAVRSRSR